MNRLIEERSKEYQATQTQMKFWQMAIIILLLSMAFCLIAKAKTKRNSRVNIPEPIIDSINNNKTSQGTVLDIQGSGFIKNFANVHKLFLKKSLNQASFTTKRKRRKKIKLKALNSTIDNLQVKLPDEIDNGDYNLYLKLKTRFLRSRVHKAQTPILIRPIEPIKPSLNFKIVNSLDHIANTIDYKRSLFKAKSQQNQDQIESISTALKIKVDNLKLGKNQLNTFYQEDGFESLMSTPVEFYFLPENNLAQELTVKSEDPISAVVKVLNCDISTHINNAMFIEDLKLENQNFTREDETLCPIEIDVSNETTSEINDLSKHFYLKAASNSRYLETIISIKPIVIDKLHVKSPEFVIIKNRSNQDFSFIGCELADDVKTRYRFNDVDNAPQILEAKSSLQIEANLGLNDTSPDSMSLLCPKQKDTLNNEAQELQLIDKFNYSKLNDEGFAVKG